MYNGIDHNFLIIGLIADLEHYNKSSVSLFQDESFITTGCHQVCPIFMLKNETRSTAAVALHTGQMYSASWPDLIQRSVTLGASCVIFDSNQRRALQHRHNPGHEHTCVTNVHVTPSSGSSLKTSTTPSHPRRSPPIL